MPDLLPVTKLGQDEEKLYEEMVVKVGRTTKVVSGGKRMKFSALVVIGNRNGRVGYGYGKAPEVPFAVMKAIKKARKNMITIPLARNHTIPHRIINKQTSSKVIILPASEGTGLKAGYAVRAVLGLAGIKDALAKVMGSTNPVNVVKSTFNALRRLKSKRHIERLRGVQLFTPEPVPYVEKKLTTNAKIESKEAEEEKLKVSFDQVVNEFKDALASAISSDKDNIIYTLKDGKKAAYESGKDSVIFRTEGGGENEISFRKFEDFIKCLAADTSISNLSSRSIKGIAFEESEYISSLLVELLPTKFKPINRGSGVSLV